MNIAPFGVLFWDVPQLVEDLTVNQGYVGSSPTGPAMHTCLSGPKEDSAKVYSRQFESDRVLQAPVAQLEAGNKFKPCKVRVRISPGAPRSASTHLLVAVGVSS